jgi:hypothetical protein
MEICGGQGNTRTGLLHGPWLYTDSNIPRMIRTHSFTYYRRCVVVAIQNFFINNIYCTLRWNSVHYNFNRPYLDWQAWILCQYAILRSWYFSRVWLMLNCRSELSFAFSSAELSMLERKWQCVISFSFNNSSGSKSPYMELEVCLEKSGQDLPMSPYFLCL